MSTELAIIRKENIELIVSSAPEAYRENVVSHDRCIEAGKLLLQRIADTGMTDELDQQVAIFLEKARKTVRKMNDKRAPLTKLFDEIRTTFTGMENDIDASKSNSVPALLQAERNRYAAKKREEELARQREAMRQQQIEQARAKYRTDCDSHYRSQFRSYLDFHLEGLRNLFAEVTLDNYDERMSVIANFNVTLSQDDEKTICSTTPPFYTNNAVPLNEIADITSASFECLLPHMRNEFERTLLEERQRILQLMPSKKMELERAAKASAEEAERIRQQMKEREEAEAKRMEQERQQREQQQRMEDEMKAKQSEMGSLFDQAQVATPTYQPKTSVRKKLVPMNVEAFPEIITMWWTKEGCKLSIEELTKMFKKQITFCEKCAKDGELIQSEHIYYEDEVTAK